MNAPAVIVPRQETAQVRRGRAIILQVIDRVLELNDRGKTPTKVLISTALRDDLLAYFDFNFVFDGVLPSELSGVPIEYIPGADLRVHIETR